MLPAAALTCAADDDTSTASAPHFLANSALEAERVTAVTWQPIAFAIFTPMEPLRAGEEGF